MINVAVYKDALMDAVGVPTLFFENGIFLQILHREDMQRDIVTQFGEGICIGCLGTKTANGYVESKEFIIELPDERRGDLSFYEKL